MEQYLYTVRPARADMLSSGATSEERRAVTEGLALLAGRTQASNAAGFGLVIFRAESPASARMIVDSDPAVKGGVFLAELFPYRVALLARPELQTPWVPDAD